MATNKTIGTLLLRIEADAKALRKGMTQTQKSVQGLKKSFNMLAGAVGVALGAQAVIRFTKEIITLAGAMEGVRDAFKRIAQPGLLDDLRSATKGTVSDLKLMQRAVMAHNFKIPLKDLASLFAFATKRAQQTGESVDYLVNSIVIGIGRKSPLILDNLGISAVRLREELEHAGHSGATVGQVAAAVGKIAQQEMSKAGDIIETVTIQSAQLETVWDNTKIVIGEAATAAFNLKENLKGINDILILINRREGGKSKLSQFSEELKDIRQVALRVAPVIGEVATYLQIIAELKGYLFEAAGKKAAEKTPYYDTQRTRIGGGGLRTPKPSISPFMSGTGTDPMAAAPGRVTPGGFAGLDMTGANVLLYLDKVAPEVAKNIKDSYERIKKADQDMVDSFIKNVNKGSHAINEFESDTISFGIVFQQTFMEATRTLGTFIEQLAAGEFVGENFGKTVLAALGQFAVTMGELMVAYGIAKKEFLKFDNPYATIAAGIALIAIGSAIKGLASRGPSTSSSGGTSGGYEAQPVQVTGRVDGRYLYIVNRRGEETINNIT